MLSWFHKFLIFLGERGGKVSEKEMEEFIQFSKLSPEEQKKRQSKEYTRTAVWIVALIAFGIWQMTLVLNDGVEFHKHGLGQEVLQFLKK